MRKTRRQSHHVGRGARLAAWEGAAARSRARPATIPTVKTRRTSSRRWPHQPATIVCTTCHTKYREKSALAQHAHHDPAGRGRRVRRLPHAEEEHGARLRAHALPPHRLADRHGAGPCATGRSSARSATRTRACPRSSRAWKRGGAKLTTGGRSRTSTVTSTRMRSLRRFRGARRTKRRWRSPCSVKTSARRTRARWRRELTDAYPLVRYYAKYALSKALGAPCPIDVAADAAHVDEETRAWLRTLSGGTARPLPSSLARQERHPTAALTRKRR